MSRFVWVTFTNHALDRMKQRSISRDDVIAVLETGEGVLDEDGTWTYEMPTMHGRSIRVIVVDEGDSARVITVMRLRKST